MAKKLKIAIAQLNFTVGDIEGNKAKIIEYRNKAAAKSADLIIFSELALTGYPTEDLILKTSFQEKAKTALRHLTAVTSDNKTAMLVGSVASSGKKIFNSAFLLAHGKILYAQAKHELPNYGVFDEKRIFSEGSLPEIINFKGIKLGIMVCEDMWLKTAPAALKGADILISINGSPFEKKKFAERVKMAMRAEKIAKAPVIYVNQVGGQDELIFDGSSFALQDGKIKLRCAEWVSSIEFIEFDKIKGISTQTRKIAANKPEEELIYGALVTGLRDYVDKNGFPGVVIGLSGGMDSALSAVVAVDALGSDRVRGLFMPSRYTSEDSRVDAMKLAKNLGIKIDVIPIETLFTTLKKSMEKVFKGRKEDATEENMQARIRGIIQMSYSNKFGYMLLTTGNKSEMSVGYATLYGDMCGGYSVLKDIYKTEVYRIAEWRNKQDKPIPQRVFTKAPTAELRENQKDEDSLPPYHVLDDILEKLVEMEMSLEDIVNSGHEKTIVEKVILMLKDSEYKRRQAPPGVKITSKSFGRDRRYPITNKFKY